MRVVLIVMYVHIPAAVTTVVMVLNALTMAAYAIALFDGNNYFHHTLKIQHKRRLFKNIYLIK
jgi:hypothetical protein